MAPSSRTTISGLFNDKMVFILSIIVFFYFSLLIVFYKLQYETVLISVFRELLTIPAFILFLFLFVKSIVSFVKLKYRIPSLPFYTLVLLFVLLAIIILNS